MHFSEDSGIYAFVKLASLHQISLNAEQIQHDYADGMTPLTLPQLLRAMKSYHFKAKAVSLTLDNIDQSVLPCLLKDDARYFILIGINEKKEYLLLNTSTQKLEVLEKSKLTKEHLYTVIYAKPKKHTTKEKAFGFSWFIPTFWKYKHIFRDVLIASLFLQIFALVTPLFFQVVMDKVISNNALETLQILAIGFIVICIFDVVFTAIRNYLLIHTSARIDVELSTRLYKHLMHLPLSYFEKRQVGQSVARIKELDKMRSFLTSSALLLLIDSVFALVFLVIMWLYSSTLTLIVLASIPAYVILSLSTIPLLRRRLEEAFSHGAKNQSFLTESISGIRTIKSLTLEPSMQKDWERNLSTYITSNFNAQKLANISSQIAQFISKLTTVLILYLGVKYVLNGQLTIGQLIAFNMFASRLSAPILKLIQLWQDFQQALISVKKLGDIFNAKTEYIPHTNQNSLQQIGGEIHFCHLSFRYTPNSPLVLKDINLHIKANQQIGIVGLSGSGKSTLAQLIQRLYMPESGKILIDQLDIFSLNPSVLRQKIGVVLQESFLFNRSIRDNVAINCPGASLDKVIKMCKLSGAHEFISSLKYGYDTLIEEQGVNLSGGQKQRLAIARALMNDPKILIFDEATSALDYASERIIQKNMAEITQNRTCIFIAHRLTTVMHVDKLVYMEEGSVVESGTHDELLALKGHYARLFSAQFADKNVCEH
ncbi:peptidase domain-containing ABC transporter [Fangia hongkongensis]|uniref:peptidase domain-containing ABC transporter n=1 Tax=Fangia hongkongensis TaxID=270495 RepID=UPI00037D2A9A|nr:type I secretion system permease/ATPase [Fangia hongkongensis]MBK2126332.1 type I secretion system permease/ATPase [Fangia hongkongensis]